MLLWACGLMFAGWDVNRQFCRPAPSSLSTYWEIYTELNQICTKSSVDTNIFLPACTSPLCLVCCWSLWGAKGCISRCSRGMSCHLVVILPPPMADSYHWMLQLDPLSPRPCSLFMPTHKQSWFIRMDIVRHSITQLLFRFSISQTAPPKESLQSQGLFTGNHEYVKPSRCLLLLLLSRGVSQ